MDLAVIERTLGSLGTAFRLSRLYPPTHPAVMESVRQLHTTLPALAGQGTVEWRVGSTGFMVGTIVVLPRNTQLAELASLLYSRGVRSISVDPGAASENLLAICRVATGAIPLDDATLGKVALTLGRRSTMRMQAAKVGAGTGSAPAAPAPAAAPPPAAPIHAEALPPDVVAERLLTTLRDATDASVQTDAARQVAALAREILGLKDVRAVATVISTLDQVLAGATDPALVDAIGKTAEAFGDKAALARMVTRLGEPLVPPPERAALVRAVGAMAAVTAASVLDAFLSAPPSVREPYRAAVRHAADRAVEPLAQRLSQGGNVTTLLATAELLGLTGSGAALPALQPLLRHGDAMVREGALAALSDIGGREAVRMSLSALRDQDPGVRRAAARAIGASGDASAATVLVGRLGSESDQVVMIAILKALGALGDAGSVELVAQFADAGGMFQRRPVEVRVAAVEGLAGIRTPEAQAVLERLRNDKEPAVRAAVEAALA